MRVVLREKGRITIPATIRNALGVRSGDQLEVSTKDAAIVLKPVRTITSKEIKGIIGRSKIEIEEIEEALGRDIY